ncbi:MAG: phenylacetic acid degradation bifunctional protein PaaZ [Meiothermus sp.]|uniref:phenylacetic acid degradation bifunctional protein PaaZ n=1 Tax=Meiothermus sp. TaxID=1955249 RepID=UPI0025E053DA|nr:phenylacetic acid degradation bifunctional protein PaaZ [Meiothermus sp.]MCS7058921.1 phenylacetic acid degradation bifunctional protein PaaZ [Meiothermus sp.]MCS7193494.1 phenylacetic acid degradation bifunctional protein PaaZ [Meiothermus sp.]MCX7741506.1 phenylacetic acid degradation bifunctional protein PaaZ [Meiothermus sp.]MDW8090114.1 phenylacetic acid degradation bifunctional protein PaaZ [Meiothermus sp.]MDW8481418.1 phenylacetic acid degradation bifunctional protein PaaZ [Meiother
MKLKSYAAGVWFESPAPGVVVRDAVWGEPIAEVSSEGLDFAEMVRYAREVGGPALRRHTFHERAAMLRALAQYLLERKEAFYTLSYKTGATRHDSWFDIDGGIGTFFSYASLARRELPNERFLVEDDPLALSKGGSFLGRHLLVPKEGVAVHINAYNFPVWGMLEKLAPGLIAGVPAIVKPATQTAYLTEAVFRAMLESKILPEGAIQLVCGSIGDLFDHLSEQDSVTFTGSAATGRKLKTHPNLVAHSVPFNMEADSLNCAILGQTVEPGDPEFGLFVKEVAREMTVKAGQKCTAIRRVIVPRGKSEAVLEALKQELSQATLGDPSREDVRMGPLVGAGQRADVLEVVRRLKEQGCEVAWEGSGELLGGDPEKGGFMPPTLLYSAKPWDSAAHDLEPFGPVATLMPYEDLDEAVALARRGRGSLVGSIVTYDREEARRLFFGCATHHGRMLILNRDNAKESTGHGSPLPPLVHGGPGRAGGGEELGGLRGIKHYLQRCAVQTDPTTLMVLCQEYVRGAEVKEGPIHPFRKYFEDLEIGESLLTHRRTVTEADIVNFANVTGDYFYAHVDEIGAKDSIFGERVAHGYFLISAAAGLFVHPAPGPVLANYGLERLRFIEPVKIGDTLQARLTVKSKTAKDPKPGERPTGVVTWAVEIINQEGRTVALYDILTLVARRG